MLGLSYLGSFQTGLLIRTENPLEEVWTQVSRYGTDSFLARFQPDNKTIPWQQYTDYIKVRIRQAGEFRAAARPGSLLTSPLPLYYAFLSLTRAFLALGPEIMPRPFHGLKFCGGKDLLSSRAKVTEGTFADYLDANGALATVGDELSLLDSLQMIPEMASDLQVGQLETRVCAVRVNAQIRGPVLLRFSNFQGDFQKLWSAAFPSLVGVCEYHQDTVLRIALQDISESHKKVEEFMPKYFHSALLPESAYWFAVPIVDSVPLLPRAGYYFVAMFILGSIVRYQPELILPVSGSESENGWLLRRFISQAERFFPQLKLTEQNGGTAVYFHV